MSSAKQIRAEKLKLRQQIIVVQALKIVAKEGIDGLSIAKLALACHLGPGQIYRCFKDKDEIIKHLVEHITEQRIYQSNLVYDDMENKARSFAEGRPHNLNELEISVLSEILNLDHRHGVHDVVRQTEKRLMSQGHHILSQRYPNCSAEEIRAVAEVIASLTEGIILRKAKWFSADADKNILTEIYQHFFQMLDDIFLTKTK